MFQETPLKGPLYFSYGLTVVDSDQPYALPPLLPETVSAECSLKLSWLIYRAIVASPTKGLQSQHNWKLGLCIRIWILCDLPDLLIGIKDPLYKQL